MIQPIDDRVANVVISLCHVAIKAVHSEETAALGRKSVAPTTFDPIFRCPSI